MSQRLFNKNCENYQDQIFSTVYSNDKWVFLESNGLSSTWAGFLFNWIPLESKNIVSQEENLYDCKVFILVDLDASLLNIHKGCLKKPRQPNVEGWFEL